MSGRDQTCIKAIQEKGQFITDMCGLLDGHLNDAEHCRNSGGEKIKEM